MRGHQLLMRSVGIFLEWLTFTQTIVEPSTIDHFTIRLLILFHHLDVVCLLVCDMYLLGKKC